MHTDVEGKNDAGIDPNVRMYFTAGLRHGDPRFGPISRALLVAMDGWVSQGIKPPPSRVPKIADGTLVDLETYRNPLGLTPDRGGKPRELPIMSRPKLDRDTAIWSPPSTRMGMNWPVSTFQMWPCL